MAALPGTRRGRYPCTAPTWTPLAHSEVEEGRRAQAAQCPDSASEPSDSSGDTARVRFRACPTMKALRRWSHPRPDLGRCFSDLCRDRNETPVNTPIELPPAGVEALTHLRGRREVNTVIFRCPERSSPLTLVLKGNLTHDELLQTLSADATRLIVHELAFATREGARRHETLLILWAPSEVAEQHEGCVAGYMALKEFLSDVRVHLIARRKDQLDYQRMVDLIG
ncbi:hypothetical protein [Streptomyces sp. NPDC001568]|uniref:hypothetical protein n=1 Tax=Streptomyces sp. NPDC001568 TaxID=3364588 RepID=UPI00367419A8